MGIVRECFANYALFFKVVVTKRDYDSNNVIHALVLAARAEPELESTYARICKELLKSVKPDIRQELLTQVRACYCY